MSRLYFELAPARRDSYGDYVLQARLTTTTTTAIRGFVVARAF